MLVEKMMLAAVGCLLLDEGANFPLQFRWRTVAEILQRFDEKRFAFWEDRRQAIEKSGGIRVAADPATALDHRTGEVPVATLQLKIGRGCAILRTVECSRCFGDS